ncbi:MAG: hypothetical protein EXX96DRAFT_581688 [Benjaminiella poitrasii]|nr:MAG: hypothetical protein EXX96DRAFT_581688 [Benjaminiella poitrasii]
MNENSSFESKAFDIVPLIPLSPLIHISWRYAKILAQTTTELSEDSNSSETNAILKRNYAKEKAQLDRLTKSMQMIQLSSLSDFNLYDIAKEITYTNCSLFRMATLDRKSLLEINKKSTIAPLLDFHRYLSHSFAHQIIYNQSKAKDKNTQSMSIIAQLIHLAYILLHIYRDFSGCTAILVCLQMPEIQRLEDAWSQCPTKLVDVYKDISPILTHHKNFEAYRYQLWQKTSSFSNVTPNKSQMIAVPFMQAHLSIIRNLIQTRSLSFSQPKKDQQTESIFSISDVKSFVSTIRLLKFCQQYLKIDSSELEKISQINVVQSQIKNKQRLSFRSIRSSDNTKSIQLSVSPCLDLDQLHSNPQIYHWLVSRPYLTRHQLYCESLNVKPSSADEAGTKVTNDFLSWYFTIDSVYDDSHGHIGLNMLEQSTFTGKIKQSSMKPAGESFTRKNEPIVQAMEVSVQSSEVSKEENVHCKKGDQEQFSLYKTTAKILLDNETTRKKMNSTTFGNVMLLLGEKAQNKTYSNVCSQIQQLNLDIACNPEDNNSTKNSTVGPKTISKNVEDEQMIPNVIQTSRITQQDIKLKQETLSNDLVKDQNGINIIEAKTSPIISPSTKLENDFYKMALKVPLVSKIKTADTITQEEEMSKSDDNQWTGYTIDSLYFQTHENIIENEEEWTGYPIGDSEEEEDEIWKGYPLSEEEL